MPYWGIACAHGININDPDVGALYAELLMTLGPLGQTGDPKGRIVEIVSTLETVIE